MQFAFVGPQAEAFRSGDHWTIPARTVTGTVEWPRNNGVPLFEPSRAARTRVAALGVSRLNKSGWRVLHDCRRKFGPLNGFVQMEYVGGDGQEAKPDPNQPTNPLPRPLEVAVTNGRLPVVGASVQFSVGTNESGVLTAGAATGPSVTAETDSTGVATCSWAIDGVNQSQQVTATLLDDLDQAPPNPIHFNANLSVASGVAYKPNTACVGLAGTETVQEAIDRLAQIVRLEYVAGDAQEVPAADATKLAPLVVRVVNDCGPVDEAQVRFIATGGGTVDGSPIVGGVSTVDATTKKAVIGADNVRARRHRPVRLGPRPEHTGPACLRDGDECSDGRNAARATRCLRIHRENRARGGQGAGRPYPERTDRGGPDDPQRPRRGGEAAGRRNRRHRR